MIEDAIGERQARSVGTAGLRRRRAPWLSLAALALVPLVIAAGLSPSPSGHGTHLQLGMSPCAFLAATGHRCPACGMTTAFADMIRGRVLDALRANALGVLLFLGDVAGVMAAIAAGVAETSVVEALRALRRSRVIEVTAVALLVWTAIWLQGWCASP